MGFISNLTIKRSWLIALSCMCLWAPGVIATEYYGVRPEVVLEGGSAEPWARIERHIDYHPDIPNETSHSSLKQFYPQVVEAFGTSTPHANSFLLHLAPNWNRSKNKTPILLVTGANDDASRRFAHPESTQSSKHYESKGLMQHLVAAGHPVFAISFSHLHGNNIVQGEHIANAIRRIKHLMRQEGNSHFKVNLVGFSKGAMAIRSYLQSVGPSYDNFSYLTRYRGDVNHVVFAGAPLGGIDIPFRYYIYNLFIQKNELPAPLGAEKMFYNGKWQGTGENDILSGRWQGQLQMLMDQRKLGVMDSLATITVDANMSKRALSEGGETFFVSSKGLNKAIEAGGHFMSRLSTYSFPRDVSFSVLAGNNNTIRDEKFPERGRNYVSDMAEANDGLIFLKSATYTEPLERSGAVKQNVSVLPLNHLDLSRSERAFQFIEQELTTAKHPLSSGSCERMLHKNNSR